jgi:hypothetical protein
MLGVKRAGVEPNNRQHPLESVNSPLVHGNGGLVLKSAHVELLNQLSKIT